MGDKSKIEWTDASWNPVTGCTKVSDGCKHCYAERDWQRIAAPRATPNLYTGRPFTDVRCHAEKLDQPVRWRRPRRIFVNSMSDLFHEDVPNQFIADVFAVMSCTTRHTYQVLTKRPQRMLEWFKWAEESDNGMGPEVVDPTKVWPEWKPYREGKQSGYDNCGPDWPCRNVHIGVSAENQKTFDERVEHLAAVPAAVRFVSLEPLLGEIDCGNALDDPPDGSPYGKIDWVIAGGESGPEARPSHPDWVRSLRDQCVAAGVPFFFKQWGQWLPEGQQNASGVLCEDAYIFDEDEFPGTVHFWADHTASIRVRKKELGRLLDGKLWDEYPKTP